MFEFTGTDDQTPASPARRSSAGSTARASSTGTSAREGPFGGSVTTTCSTEFPRARPRPAHVRGARDRRRRPATIDRGQRRPDAGAPRVDVTGRPDTTLPGTPPTPTTIADSTPTFEFVGTDNATPGSSWSLRVLARRRGRSSPAARRTTLSGRARRRTRSRSARSTSPATPTPTPAALRVDGDRPAGDDARRRAGRPDGDDGRDVHVRGRPGRLDVRVLARTARRSRPASRRSPFASAAAASTRSRSRPPTPQGSSRSRPRVHEWTVNAPAGHRRRRTRRSLTGPARRHDERHGDVHLRSPASPAPRSSARSTAPASTTCVVAAELHRAAARRARARGARGRPVRQRRPDAGRATSGPSTGRRVTTILTAPDGASREHDRRVHVHVERRRLDVRVLARRRDRAVHVAARRTRASRSATTSSPSARPTRPARSRSSGTSTSGPCVPIQAPQTTLTDGPAGRDRRAQRDVRASRPTSRARRSRARSTARPFTACDAPAEVAGLGVGEHAFEVRATDVFGNADPHRPATSGPSSASPTCRRPSSSGPAPTLPVETQVADSRSPASVAGVTFECSLDGAPFAACTSPAEPRARSPRASTPSRSGRSTARAAPSPSPRGAS